MSYQLNSSQSVHLPPHYCGPGSGLHPFSSATNSECSLIICQGKHPKVGTKSFSCLNTSVGVSSCTILKKKKKSNYLAALPCFPVCFHLVSTFSFLTPLGFTETRCWPLTGVLSSPSLSCLCCGNLAHPLR